MTLDRHRALKLRRLQEARDKISEFASRKPKEEDPEFSDWWRSVADLLGELGGSGYVMRWQTVRFSAVRYNYIRGFRITGDPVATWQSGLQQADKILQEAIEAAELGPAAPTPAQGVANPSGSRST